MNLASLTEYGLYRAESHALVRLCVLGGLLVHYVGTRVSRVSKGNDANLMYHTVFIRHDT